MNYIDQTKNSRRNRGGYLQVKDYIQSTFQIGDQLPSEQELADQLSSSRYAIIRALTELSAEGVIERTPGRGTVITGQNSTGKNITPSIVAFLADEFESHLIVDIMRGADDYFRSRNVTVALCNSDYDIQHEVDNLAKLTSHGYTGAIGMLSENMVSNRELERLVKQGYPIVLVDRHPDGIECDWVETDHEKGAYLATQYLIELGHRRIAHITYEDPLRVRLGSVCQRERGYRRALKEAGLPIREEYIKGTLISNPYSTPAPEIQKTLAYIPTHQLLCMDEPPTAIFIMNDYFAPGVIQAIENHGLRVPGDISIVGFDNNSVAQEHELTTIAQPGRQIGYRAAEMLNRRIHNRTIPMQFTKADAKLVVRNSTRKL